ncbi:MAG: transporter substrate-binding domain-containing protein [Hyphomicrobium sp.]|nr:transporter substrate-binding domain-containing protein [Hyphomicrobium sp.]
MDPQVVKELAPRGVLRAGINLSNFLLVTGKTEAGDPVGVAPDMAAEIARRLGVGVSYVPFAQPGPLSDKVDTDTWDIGLIGAEPQRAQKIAFSTAYCEIQSTYLVPPGSRLNSIADVDKPGVKIACTARTAYGLWLENNIKHATLVWTESLDNSFDKFVTDKLDALAGLKPKLISEVKKMPGAIILDGQFSSVQQAIGTSRKNPAAAAFLQTFVDEAKSSGLVAKLIAKHKVVGLSVAP